MRSVTFRATQRRWLRAIPALLLFPLLGGGVRSLTPRNNVKPLRGDGLQSLVPAAEPVEGRSSNLGAPRVLVGGMRLQRAVTAIHPEWVVMVVAPQAAHRRTLRRMKIPPSAEESVPPH
jgi:hypothetical protein